VLAHNKFNFCGGEGGEEEDRERVEKKEEELKE
jgi:hypothetical protein